MFYQTHSSGFYVLLISSFLIALLVAVYPISMTLSPYRPELVCLIIIYWSIHTPTKVGMGWAAIFGLLQDVIEGVVWGAHMMALSMVAYICVLGYQRIKSYSVWHQSLWVFILVGLHQMVVDWIQGLQGYRSDTLVLILSMWVTALLWPVMTNLYLRINRFYRVA